MEENQEEIQLFSTTNEYEINQVCAILEENNIPFEMHIFPNGRHGMGLGNTETARNPDPSFEQWMPLSVNWLNRLFFSEEKYNPETRARFKF